MTGLRCIPPKTQFGILGCGQSWQITISSQDLYGIYMDLWSVVSFVERILSTTTLKEESTHDTHQQHHLTSKQPPVCMGSAYMMTEKSRINKVAMAAPSTHWSLQAQKMLQKNPNPQKTLKETRNLDRSHRVLHCCFCCLTCWYVDFNKSNHDSFNLLVFLQPLLLLRPVIISTLPNYQASNHFSPCSHSTKTKYPPSTQSLTSSLAWNHVVVHPRYPVGVLVEIPPERCDVSFFFPCCATAGCRKGEVIHEESRSSQVWTSWSGGTGLLKMITKEDPTRNWNPENFGSGQLSVMLFLP